jgi:hypothetical protein
MTSKQNPKLVKVQLQVELTCLIMLLRYVNIALGLDQGIPIGGEVLGFISFQKGAKVLFFPTRT